MQGVRRIFILSLCHSLRCGGMDKRNVSCGWTSARAAHIQLITPLALERRNFPPLDWIANSICDPIWIVHLSTTQAAVSALRARLLSGLSSPSPSGSASSPRREGWCVAWWWWSRSAMCSPKSSALVFFFPFSASSPFHIWEPEPNGNGFLL